MRITRVKRTRHLALVKPGDQREHLRVRLTATQGERTVSAQNSVPAARGLVWLTVTEFSFEGA